MKHEIELLSWMDRPVLVLLNQIGGDAHSNTEAWRARLQAFGGVRGGLPLDAFSRTSVAESLVLERAAELLDGSKRDAMGALLAAWNARNLRIFEASVDAIAEYLAGIAMDREPIVVGRSGETSWLRERLSDLRALARADRERSMGA